MCGIAGQLMLDAGRAASPEAVTRMLDALVHRGPDDQGLFCEGPVAIGMRRLSIIDLAGGHQPIFSEDGRRAVVLNGEIYNYVELRERLEARGHRFATHSDTEVIVHLYEDKGPDCVDDLNGMFAFALWDGVEGRLMLARDRLGIKPLHTHLADGRLLFASEIGALIADPHVSREMDPEALDDYLTYFYIPGERSIYRSIRKVPPATVVLWQGGRSTERRYWRVEHRPPSPEAVKPIDHYAEAYREQLSRSVRLQLRSDVPLGVFLSGGLDSGSVVAAITRLTNRPPATFTVGFDDASYNEEPYALEVARRYGAEHHAFRIQPADMLRSAELISHFGEPYGPFTLVQSHAISRYSREHIKVALAGDGGDELFGGYQTYLASRMARRYLRLSALLRRGVVARLARLLPVSDRLMSLDFKVREFVRGAEMFARAGNMAWKIIFDPAEKARLLSADLRRTLAGRDSFAHARRVADDAGGSDLFRWMHTDLAMFLPDCVLTCTDRMSMAVSQEVRVPILDHELVEFAATVPDCYKVRRGRTKVLVRHAMADWLPPSVLDKPKTGFTTPVPIWIRGPLREFVRDTLSPEAVGRTGLFEPAAVTALLDAHMAGRADHARRIWALLNFMLWHKQA